MRAVVGAAILVLSAGCASSKYLAKVNHETLTGKELRAEFARHHAALDKILADDADIRKYVNRLVDRRLFVQEGYRLGLQDAPDVRENVARVRAQKMIELFRQDEVEARSKVSEEEVKAVHAGLKEQIEIRQVVLRTKAEADAVAAELAAGRDLEALARERSITESAKQGGMLVVGWGYDEAYEQVLFGLAEGAVSPVFESQAGWEVARLEKRKTFERPPLEKVASKIRQVLQKRKRLAREHEVYSALWSKYGAKHEACVPDVEAVKAAAATKDQTACASWRSGTVTAEALAGRVKLDQLGTIGPRWAELRTVLVEDLVNRELVVLEAEERGYGARPEVLDRLAVLQDDLVESKLYREHVVKGLTADDEDARRYFQENAAQFMEDAQYELAQVLVDTLEVAKEVEEKVRSRQPFAEIAAAYSKDKRNAADGGRVGFMAKGMLKDEFAPLATLNEGEVSAPLRASDGYHVVKVLSIVPGRQHAYDEVKEQARARALEAKQKAEVARWIATLRAAAKVEISDRGIRAYGNETREALRAEEAKRAEAAAATPPAAKPAEGTQPGAQSPTGAPGAGAPSAAPEAPSAASAAAATSAAAAPPLDASPSPAPSARRP